jgi:two-component system, NarL family, nitrate/nitrite response regulator NarL
MRIVICDDHLLLLEALSTALAARGFVVEAATTTPDDAVEGVALHDPDVLLTDVSFPTGSGLEAAREVMRRHPRTKVVLMTGSDAPEPLVEALDIGVAGYTRKDQRVDRFAEVLHAVGRGETAVDKGLLRRLSRQPRPGPPSPLDALTPREREIGELLVDGLDTTQMVQTLGITYSTTRTHVQSILFKLGVHSRLQAVAVLSTAIGRDQGTGRRPDRRPTHLGR